MWQLGDERKRRYRCYLGHASSARAREAREEAELVRRFMFDLLRQR